MIWTCSGCDHIYMHSQECPTCSKDAVQHPVKVTVEGVEYDVQRQLQGPTAIVRSDGSRLAAGERALVIFTFLAQQHDV